MRRSDCSGALQYVPELTRTFFLRILDERGTRRMEEAEAIGPEYTSSLEGPYRWQEWAAPAGSPSALPTPAENRVARPGVADGPPVRAQDPRPIHSDPSVQTSFFQMGTATFRRSMA